MFTVHRFLKLPLSISIVAILLSCGGAEERKAKYIERGKAYLAEKNYDKAMVEFKNVLQIDPKSSDGFFLLGQVEESKKDYGKAYGDFSMALDLNPDNQEARIKLARIYLMSAQADKAEEMVNYILKKKPGDTTAKLILGGVLSQKGNVDGAFKLALEVVRDDPSKSEAARFLSALYANKGDLDNASKVLEACLARNPKDIDLHNALVQVYLQRKDVDKAERILEDVVKLEPDDMQYRVSLAKFYSQEKQFDKAEKVLREAIKVNPKDSERYGLLADFLIFRNRSAEAESEILSAIEALPKEDRLRFTLAKYYRSVGKIDQAEGIYRKVIEIDSVGPSGMDARKQLADLLRDQKKTTEATKLIAEVLKDNPQDPEALLIRGKLELSQDNPDLQAAITDFRTILKNQPNSAEVLTLLAVAHQLNHEPDLTKVNLQNAAKAAPNDASITIRLAQFLVANDKDIYGALKILNQFLSTNPNDLSVLQKKLELLAMKKDGNAILETLAHIKKVYPDKPVGYYRAGEYYLLQGQFQEALHEFEQSRDRSKGEFQSIGAISTVYLRMDKPAESIKVLNDYLAANPKNLDALQMKAGILASSKDVAGFTKMTDQIKLLYPDQANGYYLAGEYYLEQKDYDSALRELKAAAEKSPADTRISASILKTYLDANKSDEALAWLAQLEKNKPNDGYIHYLMAEALLAQKKYADTEAQLQKALQLMPVADVENMPRRNEVYVRLADINVVQKRLDIAIKILKQGLADIPDDTALLVRLASVYQLSGQYDDAITIYNDMLKSNPGSVLAANNLASLLADYKSDKSSLERAKKLAAPFESSAEPALLDTLGWVYYKLGDIDNAVPLLKKAADGAPKAGVMHYHLGMAYYKKGNKVAAKDELTRAFAANEKFAGDEEGHAILKTLQ